MVRLRFSPDFLCYLIGYKMKLRNLLILIVIVFFTFGCGQEEGTITTTTGSPNPKLFTDNGDGTITDNYTNLIWQKEDDELVKNWATAGSYCTVLDLAGTGWRLPSIKELQSIVSYQHVNPLIDPTFFPNTKADYYWTSDDLYLDPSGAWIVGFGQGNIGAPNVTFTYYVRCVKDGVDPMVWYTTDFTDMTTDVVSHASTGLMWQKSDDPSTDTWAGAATYCGGLNIGGFNDWRLPNLNELISIVDYGAKNPAINQTYFQDTDYVVDSALNQYWSSTTNPGDTNQAFSVEFSAGNAGGLVDKTTSYSVRCVRGGQ